MTSGTTAAPSVRLDARQRAVLDRVAAAERASIAALPTDDPLDPKRRARVAATLPELVAQPQAVRATWAAGSEALERVASSLLERRPERVLLTGAGDSLAVLAAARLALEGALGVPCEPVQSLELAKYQVGTLSDRTLVVALSSSGETTRTAEALLLAQHAGAATLALTNTPGSTLDVESTHQLHVVATRVGWPTQSSTAALALLLRLACLVRVGARQAGAEALLAELDALPEAMGEALAGIDAPLAAQAAREAAGRMYLFSGGGPSAAAAVVGAAKVKECTPDHALAVQVEEYHHYNSQKAGEPLWLIAPSGPSVPRALDTAREARRFGGRVYVVTSAGETAFDGEDVDGVVRLPDVAEELSGLLTFLPAQLVGYHLAVAKFALAEAGGPRG
ncbi:glucosamine--fructose-6-phosphate aminotransferase (isomerizing) [Motilibacter rhizosphaerae]|uniref:Glutamine--fructose-6-phosphate aminotransferase [isomerizing] n=1 Tax=Motilibacter rhizosphaerae TaxID=598652 RepID=A0A4Q7NRJ0_9ACTN|nr:SIS domain-containing protein [Motilibacter rhizosphaerae]RZS89703.1 glucosamine--fructose-6-phosphate aminotransferase (isomerizing) [Motilibacter rhizosphaerae]